MNDVPGKPAYEGWAVVELMGHRRTAGRVAEVDFAGSRMLRIDTPGPDGQAVVTQFYGGSAIYCLTPCEEAIARRFLEERAYGLPEPVQLALDQAALPAPKSYEREEPF